MAWPCQHSGASQHTLGHADMGGVSAWLGHAGMPRVSPRTGHVSMDRMPACLGHVSTEIRAGIAKPMSPRRGGFANGSTPSPTPARRSPSLHLEQSQRTRTTGVVGWLPHTHARWGLQAHNSNCCRQCAPEVRPIARLSGTHKLRRSNTPTHSGSGGLAPATLPPPRHVAARASGIGRDRGRGAGARGRRDGERTQGGGRIGERSRRRRAEGASAFACASPP